jgi:hypothetical protein
VLGRKGFGARGAVQVSKKTEETKKKPPKWAVEQCVFFFGDLPK